MAAALQQQADRAALSELSFGVLGVRVDVVEIPDGVRRMEEWIAQRDGCRYVAVTGMHGVTEAQHDSEFKTILNTAGLVVPDGMPLVWIGRQHGFDLRRRVYGPELMATFCEHTASKGYRHFFYGGAPGVADDLASQFVSRFSGALVVGTYSPPFRALTPEEGREIIHSIEGAQADLVWGGLSTPKQDRWMYEHLDRLHVPVLFGFSPAFYFTTVRAPQAPGWMGDHGLEW